MNKIALLTQETIDQIAAGEVVERPGSVVKELVENAIDAGSTAITVEIKEGGITLIRITDNGCGIGHDEVRLAFLRHSTSKIRSVEDLMCVHSLGFRGEALSSIAAIARVELITKTADELTGTRYQIEGSKELSLEEVGAPEGTTFLVKDLFFNTPARRKFLKTPHTEGTYISDLLEKLALSHPDVSFKYINNNQVRLHTSGNGNRKDLIYHIYGREIASSLIDIHYEGELFSVDGFIGKPVINRGNRNYENYFINGRYIKSSLIASAIEEAYKNFLMQHQYPFTVLYFSFPADALDVNVHPAKMELRFHNNTEIYKQLCDVIYASLSHRELIPDVQVKEEKKQVKPHIDSSSVPEPFEKQRIQNLEPETQKPVIPVPKLQEGDNPNHPGTFIIQEKAQFPKPPVLEAPLMEEPLTNVHQMTLEETASADFLTKDARKKHRIIGQLFQTYWLIEYEDKLYIIDQHAAHEKVLFEQNMERFRKHEFTSQSISPPILISLDAKEEEMLNRYMPEIKTFGFEVENFGGREYQISAVPDNLYYMDMKDLFIELLDDFSNLTGRQTPELIWDKLATMSCKAAIKGNDELSMKEADALIDQLLSLDNPFNCPHGRPTIIAMSKYEIEKKFKRIVS